MKVECKLEEVFDVTMHKLQNGGLLLSSRGKDERYNVMTIGWGLVGRLWRDPVFMVAVRPSRYTFELMEETSDFVVNVPADEMDEVVAYCGRESGRIHDKIKETGLTTMKSLRVKSPLLSECVIHFECDVIGKAKVLPELLSSQVQGACYASGDYHTLYFGKIVSILKDQ